MDLEHLGKILAQSKEHLKELAYGAILCFNMNKIRYITSTAIGTWVIDKPGLFRLLYQVDDSTNWDLEFAAKHHNLCALWCA